ncbi:hypothetical protein [Streptomyces sp. NPDC047123]|uniref:hypothetical protein n=1 Tax=Streptomyces sp. NPDC047123 TaxID=3155622 RepID=UPI0033DFEF17
MTRFVAVGLLMVCTTGGVLLALPASPWCCSTAAVLLAMSPTGRDDMARRRRPVADPGTCAFR